MNFLLVSLLGFIFYSTCVNGSGTQDPGNPNLSQLRSIATHLLANNSNGTSPTEMANHMIQSITGMKYNLLQSLANFLAPVIQSILIFAVILFGVAGTGSIVCSLFDCQGGLGLNGILDGNHYGHLMSGMPYASHQGFVHLNALNNDPNSFVRTVMKRKNEFQRKPWTMMPSSSPPLLDGPFE